MTRLRRGQRVRAIASRTGTELTDDGIRSVWFNIGTICKVIDRDRTTYGDIYTVEVVMAAPSGMFTHDGHASREAEPGDQLSLFWNQLEPISARIPG